MSQIYVSCPWSFSSGLTQVVKSIKQKVRDDKVVYSEKGADYQFSKLEQSDYVVFVLDGFAWQQKLESISRGMLFELVWCINHRIPFFLAYRAANGLGIYGAEIDDNLQFKGIAGTSDNLYQILNGGITTQNPFGGFIVAGNDLMASNVYLKGELLANPLAYLDVEEPEVKQAKSYFY